MSRGLTETKCPFHANAERSDMVAKLLEEDYYQPVANGYYGEPEDVGIKQEFIDWYNTLTKKQLFKILMTDDYGICWCEKENTNE